MRSSFRRASHPGLLLAAVATGLVLPMVGGCRIGYPFRGPGYTPGQGVVHPDAASRVLMVLTRGDIEEGAGDLFARELRAVLGAMDRHDGLVGYSVRRELLGSRVWTMSVWVDRESIERFVDSPPHARAMMQGGIAPGTFVAFYSWVNADRVPISWSEAERLLERRTSRE